MITANVAAQVPTYRSQRQAEARTTASRHSDNSGSADSKDNAPATAKQPGAANDSLAKYAQGGQQLASNLTEAQLAEIIARETLPSENAANTSANPALDKITAQFQQRFAGQAANKEEFHALMKKSFGENYDVSKAENIRQQTLKGDFSWMPKVELVDGKSLSDTSGTQGEGVGLGAFSKDTNTIYLSKDLLNTDPVKAEKILTEEVGHAIDNRINKQDAAGDEGAIFSRLSHGENISASEMKALRSENDTGVIEVDGKKVEVEFGLLKKLGKAISKPFKKAKNFVKKGLNKLKKFGKKIKNGISKAWKKVKNVVKKVLTSKLLGVVLQVARFIPIPFVQAAVTVLNIARAGYAVYQGIKHKSLGAVLGGVAGVAGGFAGAGNALGLSQGVINTATKVATYAGNASKAYNALSQKNWSSAASLASDYFGLKSPVTTVLNTAAKADKLRQAMRSDDAFGVISAGANLMQDYTGAGGDKTLQSIAKNSAAFGQLTAAVKNGDYRAAYAAADAAFGDKINLDPAARKAVDQFIGTIGKLDDARKLAESGQYLQAGQTLLNQAANLSTNPETRQKLATVGQAMVKVDAARTAFQQNRFDVAASLASDVMGYPLDNKTKALMADIQAHADQAIAFRSAVQNRDIDTATALLDSMSNGKSANLTAQLRRVAGFSDKVSNLRSAVENKNYPAASATAAELATLVAGKDSALAENLSVLSDVLNGKVQISLKDILLSHGPSSVAA